MISVVEAMGRWVMALLATLATIAAATCEPDATQFEVIVVADGPLGLRLSANLEILEFLADAQGRSRDVEASGLADIGDRLVKINGESLEQDNLPSAIEKLKQAMLPKVLRFQSHDERCVEHTPAVESVRYDYVVSPIATCSGVPRRCSLEITMCML